MFQIIPIQKNSSRQELLRLARSCMGYNLSLSFREDYLITLIEEPSVYLMMFTPFCRSFTCVPARV